MLEELDEKLDRYNLSYETVAPKNEQTIKKFQKQKLYTDRRHRTDGNGINIIKIRRILKYDFPQSMYDRKK